MVGEKPLRVLSSEELRKEIGKKKWVMPYNEIIVVYDPWNEKALLVEDFGPKNAWSVEQWRKFHYPLTSPIVEKSWTEGSRTFYLLSPGNGELKLKPAFAPMGVEALEIVGNKAKVTFAGYGGAGVSAAYGRGASKGVESVEIISEGGGKQFGKAKVVVPVHQMLLIGADDTDSEEEGATYALLDTIAKEVENSTDNIKYVTHISAQLFPYAPKKTRNCMSTVVGFIIKNHTPDLESKIVAYFEDEINRSSFSDGAAMAAYNGVHIPDTLFDYGDLAKKVFIDNMTMVEETAKKHNVKLIPIKDKIGQIGALAAIALHNEPTYAAALLNDKEYQKGLIILNKKKPQP